MKQIVIYTVCFLLMSLTLKVNAQTSNNTSSIKNYESKSSFQFVTMMLKVTNVNNKYDIKKMETRLVDGHYNESFEMLNTGRENDLVCFILDQDNNPVDTSLIRNPLSNRLEYSQDKKTINSVTIDSTEQEILFRFNYNAEMKYLHFKKIEKNGELVNITILPIDLK